MKVQAPITVGIDVEITNGKTIGTIRVSCTAGVFPTEAEMRVTISETVARAMPKGYRLMTRKEWFDQRCIAMTGGTFAMPGGPDFDD